MDAFLIAADNALRTLSGANHASRPCPAAPGEPAALSPDERRLSGALMRVNHVGEVCAQALYHAQALSTRDPLLQRQLRTLPRARRPITWPGRSSACANSARRPSLLNPLWYAGAFAIGLLAGRAGDALSLGFVVETERQVEQHLEGHLDRLPAADAASRAIVASDEGRRGTARRSRRGRRCRRPCPRRCAGRCAAAARVMTRHARTASDVPSRRRRSDDQASTLELVVISAVLPSMTLAEQYFSCDSGSARSTAGAARPTPVDDEVHVDRA